MQGLRTQQFSLALILALMMLPLTSCSVVRYVVDFINPPDQDAETQVNTPLAETEGAGVAPDEIIVDEAGAVRRSQQLESGLVIKIIRIGDGAVCESGSQVMVRFEGTLDDGTVINTPGGGEPCGPWPVEQLMPGWRQGLIGMRAGGKRQLVIPPHLAYGGQEIVDPGTGEPVIPADATLTYIIELIEVR